MEPITSLIVVGSKYFAFSVSSLISFVGSLVLTRSLPSLESSVSCSIKSIIPIVSPILTSSCSLNKISFKKVISMGSIGCKFASIIRGESDIYISLSLPGKSSPKDWDFAAPEAILKAAGGAITNVDNEELSYGKSSYRQDGIIIASSNKQTHKEICLQIKEIIMKNDLYDFDS